MKLFLLRHGEAQFDFSDDKKRSLTDFGCRQAEKVADAKLLDVKYAFVSPYLRAQQTWEIVNSSKTVHVITSDLLQPEGSIDKLIYELQQVVSNDILLVGHNPLLSNLLEILTGDQGRVLDTANLVCLQGELIAPSCMNLVFFNDFK